jgi:hypothetical protein
MLKLLSLLFLAATTTANNCVTFQVSAGTGCEWMCSYCATRLGPSYYFTTDVCSYEAGGCVGNPEVGQEYTCCATNAGFLEY